jgi:hypothetical protein
MEYSIQPFQAQKNLMFFNKTILYFVLFINK